MLKARKDSWCRGSERQQPGIVNAVGPGTCAILLRAMADLLPTPNNLRSGAKKKIHPVGSVETGGGMKRALQKLPNGWTCRGPKPTNTRHHHPSLSKGKEAPRARTTAKNPVSILHQASDCNISTFLTEGWLGNQTTESP